MVSKENYEAYLLDYIEGNLSQTEIDMLLLFLDKNPTLKDELEGFEDIVLSPTQSNFNSLNLNQVDTINDIITTNNFETFAISHLENDLSEKKENELLAVINSDKLLKGQYLLILKTKLKADDSIVYQNKSSLKKAIPLFPFYYRIAGVAAILLLMIYFLIPQNYNSTENIVLVNKNALKNDSIRKMKTKLVSNETIPTSDLITPNDDEVEIIKNKLELNNSSNKKRIENRRDITITSEKGSLKLANSKSINIKTIETNRKLKNSISLGTVNPYYEKEAISSVPMDDKFLTPKEFLASVFKKKILKMDVENPKIKIEDFNKSLANISNNKIAFKNGNGNSKLLSIQTKHFSIEKKITNKL